MDKKLDSAWWTLRLGLGVVATVAGVDKFFNLLANWPGYVSPFFASLMPFRPQVFMYVVGIIEIGVGLAILSAWTRTAAYVAMGWLLCVSLNLLTAGYFDIAARDVVMALAAFSLAKLSEVRAEVPARAHPVAIQHAATASL